ncbi:MFS multidrug transporter-like protein [Apiospora marii]|uniref:MFS multidrug transporter-like protein n=1 Tax=Apiospora marii TaxID=335849 RepID=UPI00313191ED
METPNVHSGSEEKSANDLPVNNHRIENGAVMPQDSNLPGVMDNRGMASNRNTAITSSHLHGLRLVMVTFLNATMLFLVQIEIFIVTTSLVAIAEELGDFDAASWILASYFLGYVSFVVIVAKLSDIFGRKPVYMFTILMFTLFSGCCAAAKTMPQLIILRAFQGVGGGGSFALATIVTIEIVPPEGYPTQMTYMGIAVMLALVLGPIAGGGISSVTTWRWIFLFNVPVGVVGFVLAMIGIPTGFPHHHNKALATQPAKVSPRRKSALTRLDIPGCVLLLLATMSIVSAFQEAGLRFPWGSAYFIALLVGSVGLWLVLVTWERRVTLTDATREPVLPWRFLTSRSMVGTLLWIKSGIFLQGGPLTVTNLQIPQRFQLISGLTSLDAGVRLIPFGAGLSAGTILSANVTKKSKIPAVYSVLVGAVLQIVGYALLASSGSYVGIPPAVYAYQVIAGLGCGISFQTLILLIPFVAEKRDHGESSLPSRLKSISACQNLTAIVEAVGMGAANQFRAIGSTVMVAVTTALFNGFVFPRLSALGISDPNRVIETYSQSGTKIPPEIWDEAISILSQGYNRQMYALVACGAAQAFSALLLWKRDQAEMPGREVS